ncbi:MAG: hypothetical protein MJZ64_03060 [Paludibacteraceae bacterium]|nr:hypothetical protein [Paludibacteraceae bacterium]
MAKIKPIDNVAEMHGKQDSKSDYMFVTNARSKQISTRKIAARNFDQHPVTSREKETNDKMRELVAEYKRIKSDPEAFAQLVEERHNAPIDLQCANTYLYFLKTRMDEGKNSVTLKIAKSKSNEDSYVEGLLRCHNREEADRLLVDFVEKLGYKKLAQAYNKIVKESK